MQHTALREPSLQGATAAAAAAAPPAPAAGHVVEAYLGSTAAVWCIRLRWEVGVDGLAHVIHVLPHVVPALLFMQGV